MASAGSPYWFPSHSMSLESLHGFSSCPPKWSITIPTRKGPARVRQGKQSSFHHLLIPGSCFLAALWFHTLFHWPQRTSAGIRWKRFQQEVLKRFEIRTKRQRTVRWNKRETRCYCNNSSSQKWECGRCCWLLPTLDPLTDKWLCKFRWAFSAQMVHLSVPLLYTKPLQCSVNW